LKFTKNIKEIKISQLVTPFLLEVWIWPMVHGLVLTHS